ncbi:MAG: TIGR01620 family protein [Bosea sp.]|nr:TIGR01620 family protein [Bosea sp. (in: a-proteobacteria)]
MSADPKAPRAFRLEPGDAGPAGGMRARDSEVDIVAEVEPQLGSASAPDLPRKTGWLWALGSALSGLALISLCLWVQDAVIAAIRQSDVLGLVALGLAVVAAIAGLVLAARFLRDLLRERRIERLRVDAAAAITARSAQGARAVAEALAALQAHRPQTAQARARFAAALPGMSDARDIIALAERELLEPLDRMAADEIARAARQVSVVTAVSPRALVDIIFVVFAGGRLLRAVTSIYGGRPGTLGLLRIARASVSHLLVTGGLAAGDAVIQQLVGQGLAARLSARLGEGVLNGLMTARFGLAALSVCRPLPFVEAQPPTLADVASGLLSSRETPAQG